MYKQVELSEELDAIDMRARAQGLATERNAADEHGPAYLRVMFGGASGAICFQSKQSWLVSVTSQDELPAKVVERAKLAATVLESLVFR